MRLPARRAAALLALALWLAACGGGGSSAAAGRSASLGAAELGLLVAEGDATSEAIAAAYAKARGVPAANIVRVPVNTAVDVISSADFLTLKATADTRLPPEVQATLVTWTRPSRVAGSCTMSITSALAFGFDARWCANTCAATAASPIYQSGSHRPFSDWGVRPSMMLGATTLAEAQTLIARGLAADGLVSGGRATAQAWLVRTTDAARSVRWDDFAALAGSKVAGVTMHYVDNSAGAASDLVVNQPDLMFYFTGLEKVAQIETNRWLPGAAADHLTSYGGLLPDALGQMPATAWLRAGATATYGTVAEPCSFPNKFPRASVLVGRYAAGDALIEAYWKSVAWPGQGLFLGEPLARPWAP